MDIFKFRTMRNQISVSAGISLIVAVLACISIGLNFSHEIFQLNRSKSTELFQNEVAASLSNKFQVRADGIEQVITQALGAAKGMGDSMQSLIVSDAMTHLTREDINQLVYFTIKNNPRALGAYIVWEPNAVDERDADYAGQGKHTTDDGQFGPYWTRSQNNELNVRPIANKNLYSETKDAQGRRPNEWYLCPRDKKSPCIVDPAVWNVQGIPTLMTSVVYPVILNDRFVGMAGVDISMTFINTLLEDLDSHLYDGAGDLRIVSYRGLLVGSTLNQDRIGQPLDSQEWALLRPKLQSDKGSVVQQGNDFIITVPIILKDFGTPWLLEYRIPKSIALAQMFELNTELDEKFAKSLYWQIVVGFLVALVGALMLFIIAGRLAKPLQQLTKLVDGLAHSDGDITKRIGLKRHDEIGHLANALDLFLDKIQHIVRDIAALVQRLQDSSVISAEISLRTHQEIALQQNSIEQVATAATEMSSTASEVASQASLTAVSAQEAADSVQHGDQAVSYTTNVVAELAESMKNAGSMVSDLEGSNRSINGIVEVIRNISEQTNLLALNAAIEAARAGEQGRGFAVVADEVRSLASRTQASTGEIQSLIGELTGKTQAVVKAMEINQQKTNQTLQLAHNAQEKLKLAIGATHRINDSATQIASAAEEQSVVSENISKNVVEISNVVSSISGAATEVAEQSKLINSIACDINAQVSRFKY